MYEKVHVITTRQFLRRRSETFARVTCKQLHELFIEYEEETDEEITGMYAGTYAVRK